MGLATAIHRDEPPGGFFNALAHREQAVILENGRFALAEGLGDALAFGCFVDDAGKIGENGMVFVKRAGVLRDGIEQASQRRPGFSVHRMGVRSGNHIGTGAMHAGMNGEGCSIHRVFSFDDFAVMIYENQIRRANLPEVHAERVDPKMIELFGIACGDVSGDTFVESETREKPEGGGQHSFAVQSLFRRGGEHRRTKAL